ncbi:S-layer homology domain-containing protein, partial [Enorma phocaeensis]|uniref:S-layer homology domain-containing protein n=1 Tax=Enorma phocaeensis TaxID=1871019 RepID=UPI00195ECB11
MTACVNKKHTRRVALAISASLVGALSLGAAAPAFAAEGIQPLSATDVDQVENAKVTEAYDNGGQPVDLSQPIEFAADSGAHYVVPTKIRNDAAWGDKDYRLEDKDAGVYYVKVVAGPTSATVDGEYVQFVANPESITRAGTYYAVVKDTDDPSVSGNDAWVKFTIVDKTLDDAVVVGKKASDTSIEYTGADLKFSTGELNIFSGGKLLEYNVDYTANTKRTSTDMNNGQTNNDIPHDAGEYVVEITGQNDYNGLTKEIRFTVKQLDLSAVAVDFDQDEYAQVGSPFPAGRDDITTINGESTNPEIEGKLAFGWEGTTPDCNKAGETVFTVEASNGGDRNVTGKARVTFVRYEKAGQIRYNKQNINDGDSTLGMFDPAKVDAVKPGTNEKLPVKITYTRDGAATDTITAPGNYVATITVDDPTYEWGGKVEFAFHVAATRVDVDEVYAHYKGETLKSASFEDIYDGTDLMANFSVTALDEDDNEVPAEALDVTVTNSKGEAVDSVVEAGTYTITIKAAEDSVYDIQGGEDKLTFTVDPVQYVYDASGNQKGNAQARLTGTMGYGQYASITYVKTGQPVVPGYEYDLTAKMWGYQYSEDWRELPASAYKAEYQKWNEKTHKWEDVDECVEVGTYRAILSDADRADSYTVDAVLEFHISDQRVFADVANNEWYSQWVFTASSQGYRYMTGYAGTQFFGPNDQIKRGDVAVTLFKMAGGTLWVDANEGKDVPAKEFDTPFSDVDSSLYYAQAIQWAAKLGLVTGYDGTDEFRPEAPVSRQELAVMLARYAKMTGVDTDADLSELDAYTDGSAVADFADEAVAWAVEAGVMGQDVDALRPADAISRAEVAAMT